MLKIYACIWSNDKAAEMAKFYKSVFKDTKIGKTSYWGRSNHMGVKEGSVLTMNLIFIDQPAALHGLTAAYGQFSPVDVNFALSFAGDDKGDGFVKGHFRVPIQQHDFLAQKRGVRWQIVPADFDKWNTSRNKKKKEAVMRTMLKMVKLDRDELKKAFDHA